MVASTQVPFTRTEKVAKPVAAFVRHKKRGLLWKTCGYAASLQRKKKEPKKKEGAPPYGKVENAMNLRFPLSHRARYEKIKDGELESKP